MRFQYKGDSGVCAGQNLKCRRTSAHVFHIWLVQNCLLQVIISETVYCLSRFWNCLSWKGQANGFLFTPASTFRKARKPELDVQLSLDRKDNVQLHWNPHQFIRASGTSLYVSSNVISGRKDLYGEFNNLFWSVPESHAMTKRVSCLALDWNCPHSNNSETSTGVQHPISHTHGIQLHLVTATIYICWLWLNLPGLQLHAQRPRSQETV